MDNNKSAINQVNKNRIENSIVTCFRQQVDQYSDKIAIHTEQVSWTYHQLNQAINCIAWTIQDYCTSKSGQILLLMEQNEVMIASLFAVLTTNNLYVPLDSSYPEERLLYIAQDCEATLILTDKCNLALASRLSRSRNIPLININDLKIDENKSFTIQSGPESNAYLLYTSGTTGKPKGVLQNHRNVLHFNQVYTHSLAILPQDRITLLASFCFDAAVMDIFAALLNGATLYPYSIKKNTITALLSWLSLNKITIYHSTPTVFRFLFQNKSPHKDSLNLRLVVLGGETALHKDWEIYVEHCPDSCLLINGYGPTESTVTTQYIIDKQADMKTKTLPIGYAVADTKILITAEKEIVISSPFVALHYWGLPELSQKVFKTDQFTRHYYTGDLGHLLPDGTIEYCGRQDEQVKISGFRVELNEITSQLLDYPEIKQALCFSMPNVQGDLYLAAFFTANNKISSPELLTHLKLFLPDYMLPPVMMQVDEIPLTANGKVDSEALKLLLATLQKTKNTGFQWSETEQQLVTICESILLIKPSHRQDNIFELGCNSLLAMQLASRISQRYNMEFSIKHLFSSPTIVGLAEVIKRLQNESKLPQLSAKTSFEKKNQYPASYAQKQFFFLSQLNSTNDFSLTISVEMSGPLHAPLLQKAFLMLVERHEVLRTTLSYVENQLVQIIHDQPLAQLELIDLAIPQELRESSIRDMAVQEINRPFTSLKGPLIRAKLVRYDAHVHVFLLSCSHIIMDGWALNLFSQELSVIYNSLLTNSPNFLPSAVFQYSDYTTWQNQLFEKNTLEYQRQYWVQQLSNLPPPLSFPSRVSDDNSSADKMAKTLFVLSEECLIRLEQFSEQQHATLFMVVLSVFQMLLHRYAGQDDIIVGTPIANRHLPNTELIMGCLINVLALRGRLDKKVAFIDFLEQIKEVTLSAYDNQVLPFMKIVESLGLVRDADTNPLYQTMLVVDNFDKYSFSLQEVSTRVNEIVQENAYFDIVLTLEMQNKRLQGALKYKINLFNEQEANYFVRLFQQLLLACINHPNEQIDRLISLSQNLTAESLPCSIKPQPQFWETHLKDAPSFLKLPTDHSRPSHPDYKSESYSFILPKELHQEVLQFSQQQQVNLFITLLAAYYVLLYRYTSEEDMVVGIATVGSQALETQGINTLALRQYLSETDSFHSLVQAVNERFLQAQDYELPIDSLIDYLGIERNLNYAPLFQVMFTFLHLSELPLVAQKENSSKLEMSWCLSQTTEGLKVTIDYATALFEESTIVRMAAHWQTLLTAALIKSESKISELPLLAAYEQQQFFAWNETEKDYPFEQSIAELFAAQVEKNPDQLAVCFGEQQLSYRELNEQANQVAHYLIAQGIGTNSLVAVCLERSLELIISLLGIVKTNAAYLPLNTEFPIERLQAIVHEATPSFLISTRVFSRQYFNNSATPCLLMDEDKFVSHRYPKHNPTIKGSKSNLFYVMYTSGSTGQPKGVMIAQEGILNRFWWMQERFNLTAMDKVLQKTPYTTDTSVWEIFWPLLFGARLVVAMPNGHRDSAYLCKTILEEQITVAYFIPSMLRLFLEEQGMEHSKTSLRVVISGGEELTRDIQKLFFERVNSSLTTLYNSYGPTEASISIAAWQCRKEDSLGYVPIGRPISNTQLYILDKALQQVPIGVPGTLYIGGISLALGYLNRVELTKEHFIPNPFSADKKDKLYHTGDLCRWSSEGHIEFLGRADFQIKIRGHRIELGEIETQLKQHPAIGDCVVIAQDDALQQKKLIAYFILGQDYAPTSQELHQFLSKSLPYYMLPSAFISLPEFPLNPHGKLDRKALALPDENQLIEQSNSPGPRTDTEHRLSQIWCDLLNRSSVGVHDNFFYLGGHSILVIQIIARIQEEFHIEIPLRQLFLQPTIAALAQFIDTQKPCLSLPVIHTISRDQSIPLSYAQQRVWFFNQFEANALYHISNAWQLEGPLDSLNLKAALQQLIKRHESLRTTFIIEEHQPYQSIASSLEIDLLYIDLSTLSSSEQNTSLIAHYQELSQPIFDLSRGPLFRIALIKLSSNQHVLFFTIHHIIADGWSIHVLLRDLAHYYECTLKNKTATLPLLTIQYADYAANQQQLMTEEYLKKQLHFWRTHLNDAPPLLKFPTDYPRPAQPNYEGAHYSIRLSNELQQQLIRFSQQQQVTLFTTLLTAFYGLLYRYTGEEDIVLGTVVAHRHRLETEELIGYFANTLALRVKLFAETSFQAMLDQVKSTVFLAQEHQDVPFEQLVSHLELERHINYHPLFQTMFILQNTPVCEYRFDEACLTEMNSLKAYSLAKFDMTWEVQERSNGIELSIEYSTALFREETIARLAMHWEILLQALSTSPHITLGSCPLLSVEEHQLYALWNSTAQDYPHEQVVHQLFEEQVKHYPNNIALEFKEMRLSYSELNEQANQLAHYLIKQGITANSLVAVCLERSFDLVIVLLGILKIGAAYLPLDTEAPHKRLQFILEDSKAALLITSSAFHQEQVPEVVLERQRGIISSQSTDNPDLSYSSSQLMYVIYTSGSSGLPKGVLIEHRNAVNLLISLQRKYPLRAEDAYLLKTSAHFDASVPELFGWFWEGGRLVILESGQEKEVFNLCSFIQAKQITHAGFVPALLQMWLQSDCKSEQLLSLNYVFVVGELISKQLAHQVLDLLPSSTQFINIYGPTETTVFATDFKITREDRHTSIPIGKPLANVKTYILDRFRNPVPIGVSGEIYIGGVGVGRHYLNRPELSSEQFIEDPFETSSQRMYKTGDLGRYLLDGNIEFLGRADFQVKIRGFRVELGEIEQYLLSHPEVHQAHIQVQQDALGEKQLLAYFIPSTDIIPANSILASYLQTYFPKYMVPVAFVPMSAFPLNQNGKLDHKAFPIVDLNQSVLEQVYVAPRNDKEVRLANIWREVLKVSEIGVFDNFFHLGGHSLLAVQIILRIRTEFNIEIPLRLLFLQPTIAALSDSLNVQNPPKLLPITTSLRTPRMHLSFAQQRVWFLEQLEHNALYNISNAWQLDGPLHYLSLKAALHHLIERHEILRTTFGVQDYQPYQCIASALEVDLPYIDISMLTPVEQEMGLKTFSQTESFYLFDFTEGPLFKVTLLKLGQERHLLFLNIHHIIADGWSIGVFIEELITCYQSLITQQSLMLPALPIQYVDYTYWQLQMKNAQYFEPHFQFWEMHLKDAPLLLKLPTDNPRPSHPDYKGGNYSFILSKEVQQKAQQFSQQEQVTLFITLLTAFYVLLSRYTSDEDMVVGIASANRDALETQNLIGYLANTLAMRQHLSPTDNFHSLVQAVNERFLQAQDFKELPIDSLIDHLRIERSLNHAPLFQVMFNFLNFPQSNILQNHELRISEFHLEQGDSLSKLDMSWFLTQAPEGLKITIEYAKALFEESTIARMAAHWQTLLEGALLAPKRKISEVPLLTACEQQQFLAWNATAKDYPFEYSIAELFEAQVEKTPDHLAVCFGEQQLSYRELNEQANQVAHYLIEQGVGANSLVAVCLERSLDLIISLLGIVKANAAYLPLNTEFPIERLQSIMHEATPSFLISTRGFSRQYFSDSTISRLLVGENYPVSLNFPKHNLSTKGSKSNVLYVMYTSGSTGRPKGVMIAQEGILNRLWWMQETFNLTAMDKVLQKTPYTTDTSVWEIFWPLLFGAGLVVAMPNGHRDNSYLCRTIVEEKITVADFVPSMLRLFLEEQGIDHSNTALRVVISGGEELTRDIQKLFFERFNSSTVTLYNIYGPTEASIGISAWQCKKEDSLSYVPIGRPISNTQLYILDKARQQVPIGVPGTLYIGGICLALGYMNRAELTKERFIPNPFSADKKDKLYHTGDLCRWSAEGHIEFLGRDDFQIKIRGHRIELGEIETQLKQHPAIDNCVVIAKDDALQQKKLIAYFILGQDSAPTSQELHQFLSKSLPYYMLPSTFILLPEFPLNPHGKLDRQSLPIPTENQLEHAHGIGPRTDNEHRLCQIWCDLLNCSSVGIHDNFFYLGGNSLLMMQVIARVHKEFQIELPLCLFFLQPTIAALAHLIETRKHLVPSKELCTLC